MNGCVRQEPYYANFLKFVFKLNSFLLTGWYLQTEGVNSRWLCYCAHYQITQKERRTATI